MVSKKPKLTRNKKSIRVHIYFSGNFKVKKYLIWIFIIKSNYLIQISIILVAQININNIYLSLPLESNDLSFSFTTHRLKNNKNKFLCQNWIGKKLRCWNLKIYIIFKVNELKDIFPVTFNMLSIFSVFFYFDHLLLILPLQQ